VERTTQQSYSYSLARARARARVHTKTTLPLPLQYKLAMPDEFIFSSSWLPSPRFELRTWPVNST